MSDLRIGLVEAMASTLYKRVTQKELHHDHHMAAVWRNDAEAILDRMLGFLTDHADKWGYEHMQPPGIRDLIAALSDSRDTGEKP